MDHQRGGGTGGHRTFAAEWFRDDGRRWGLFAGVLVRGAAAAITSMFGLLLVLPVLADKITPDAVTRHTVPYLPANLGDEMLHHHAGLSPGVAVAGLAAWVLVLAAAAAFSLRGRDA